MESSPVTADSDAYLATAASDWAEAEVGAGLLREAPRRGDSAGEEEAVEESSFAAFASLRTVCERIDESGKRSNNIA